MNNSSILTIICTIIGAFITWIITKYYYMKSITKYKSVINKNLSDRAIANWGHHHEINRIASGLLASPTVTQKEKDDLVAHSANGIADAGYIDGVIKNLL